MKVQRVLGDVGWGDGLETNASWPGYQQNLADAIDLPYEKYGIQTMLTCCGGGPRDPGWIVDTILEVLKGRENKVILAEVVNERNIDGGRVVALARKLATSGVLTAPGWGDDQGQVQEFLAALQDLPNVMGTLHLERSYGDRDVRFVRQPWDFKSYRVPMGNTEGKGPLSSIGSTFSAPHLAAYRALSAVCGGGMFILHNGAGIYGRAQMGSTGWRPANIWETTGIDAIADAVAGIEALLPEGVENWVQANDGWTPPNPVNPINCKEYWADDAPATGCNKNYAALGPDGRFVAMPLGVQGDRVTFVALENCAITVHDVMAPDAPILKDKQLAANEPFTLPGAPDASRFYVINGRKV